MNKQQEQKHNNQRKPREQRTTRGRSTRWIWKQTTIEDNKIHGNPGTTTTEPNINKSQTKATTTQPTGINYILCDKM